jgi:hypothetical protein
MVKYDLGIILRCAYSWRRREHWKRTELSKCALYRASLVYPDFVFTRRRPKGLKIILQHDTKGHALVACLLGCHPEQMHKDASRNAYC